MNVVIVGPTGQGNFRVHAAGCRDIKRDADLCGDLFPMGVSVQSKREVADFVYGPGAGSFYQENGGDEAYGSIENYLDGYAADEGVFSFAPCVKGLPDKPAPVNKAAEMLRANAHFTSEGVWRWNSNNNIPFDDLLAEAGVDQQTRDACKVERDRESARFMEQYREMRARHGYSAEELAEMRAAFGPGEVIVDVLTGQKVRL